MLHVHEWGDPDGPPVICLHGVVAHGRRFRRLAEERLGHLRVLAFDLRGHGRSTWEPPWTLAQHVEDALETMRSAGIERAPLIGHSFGGRLALELTAHGVVERSVLIDPAVWVPPPIALERAELERVDRSFASRAEALEARMPTARLAPREVLEQELDDHLVRDGNGRWRYRYLQSAVVAAYGELAQPPPDWERLRVPTLLVAGAESDVVPEVVVDVFRHELGDLIEVAVVPGGHIPLWDAYEETADAIERFLA
ncbi:MAG TPA: alpha/beta hydrolase [Gaiellaceae bacterium]|nr:alpha/beta hydrolase [Gaiellaceae bacterium]